MYTPPMFKPDRAASLAFAEARGFGTVCAWDGSKPVASSLPFYLDYADDGTPLAAFHVARHNALAGFADGTSSWLMAVNGADASLLSNAARVVVSDTIPLRGPALSSKKIRVLSCAPLIGEALRRVHTGRQASQASLSSVAWLGRSARFQSAAQLLVRSSARAAGSGAGCRGRRGGPWSRRARTRPRGPSGRARARLSA